MTVRRHQQHRSSRWEFGDDGDSASAGSSVRYIIPMEKDSQRSMVVVKSAKENITDC